MTTPELEPNALDRSAMTLQSIYTSVYKGKSEIDCKYAIYMYYTGLRIRTTEGCPVYFFIGTRIDLFYHRSKPQQCVMGSKREQ